MIVVLGSCNADFHFTVDHLPKPGETIASAHVAVYAGGKGANQALAAGRAGAKVAFFGAAGSDAEADVALANLRADGVDLQHLRTTNVATGRAYIFVDAKGENFIVLTPGANHSLDVSDADRAVAAAAGGILLLQQEIPDPVTEAALLACQKANVTSVLNVSPFGPSSSRLANLADIVLTNETEWKNLAAGSSLDPDKPEAWVEQRGQTLVVTQGGDGAFLYAPGEAIHVAAPAIKPVDTVGAGDTFSGYFAAALTQGHDQRQALHLGVHAASLACLTAGAQPSIPVGATVLETLVSAVNKPR